MPSWPNFLTSILGDASPASNALGIPRVCPKLTPEIHHLMILPPFSQGTRLRCSSLTSWGWGHLSTPALFQRAPTSGRPGILWAPETWRETICPPRAASLWERWHPTSPISMELWNRLRYTVGFWCIHLKKAVSKVSQNSFVIYSHFQGIRCIKSDPLCCKELLPGDMYINDSWCSFRVHVSCDS